MHHVIFEVLPAPGGREPYLAMAARLKPMLEASGGCLTLERFARDGDGAGWLLSMQRWADEVSLARWRAHGEHCKAQASGRERVFADYRLRVATRLAQHATREAERRLAAASAPGLQAARDAGTARAVAIVEWTGDASDVPALAVAPDGSMRYTAILDTERHALVTPNLPSALLGAWCGALKSALTARGLPCALGIAAVDRDYGQFERTEAPLALA